MPSETFKRIQNFNETFFDKVKTMRSLKIIIDRKINSGQLPIDTYFLEPTEEEIKKALGDNNLRNIAEYYLCIEYDIPFYYGMDKIRTLASGNMYQFLCFCGALFERRLSYKYEAKRRRVTAISPAEQDKIIHKVSEDKWNELKTLYFDSSRLKQVLQNIAQIGVSTRNIGAGSYSGGTYTGFGIRKELFEQITSNEEYKDIKSFLAVCISNNLLKMKHGRQGNKEDEPVIIFYLNRWICVFFKLPLAYGGWRLCKNEMIEHIFRDTNSTFCSYLDYVNSGGTWM